MEQLQSNNSTADQTRSVLSRAGSNVVPSTKKLVNETIEMIKHPIQTAKSLYELGSGIVQLAIPGEQGNEDTARAVGQHFVDRYGSLEKAKETFATDPAGFALDVIGVATGGAAIGVGVAKTGAKTAGKLSRKTDDSVSTGARVEKNTEPSLRDIADEAELYETRTGEYLDVSKIRKNKEPDRSGMGDLGDNIQPSAYDEALQVSSKYGDDSILKDFGPEDVDGYFQFMDETQYLRKSSVLEDMTDATTFFDTLTQAGGPRVRRFDEDLDYNPANDMTFTKLKEKKGTFYRRANTLKDSEKVVLYTDSGKGLGGKKKKSLVLVGGKKQPTKEQILDFLDIEPNTVKGFAGEYDEILFSPGPSFQEGGFAMQQAAIQGNSSTDNLRNANLTTEEVKKDIMQKAVDGAKGDGAKGGGAKGASADIQKLLNPETLLEQEPETLGAQEGVIPVKENDDTAPLFIENQNYLQSYHNNILENQQALISEDEEGRPQVSTMLLSEVEHKGKTYVLPSYDPTNQAQLTEPTDIINLNKEAIDQGLVKGYDSLDKAVEDRIKIRNNILQSFDAVNYIDSVFGDATEMLPERKIQTPEQKRDTTLERNKDARMLGLEEGGLTENNDDTLGATGEEVADDIPAQISEGELVVPANVVRYHGLSTYEALRQSALLGLDDLKDEGQLKQVDENGVPIESEDKEEDDVKVQTVKMLETKKGGAPARYEEGGSPKVVVGGGRLGTEKTPPPYGTTRNPRGETTVKYDPPTGTGKYTYTPEGIEKFMKENPDIHHHGYFGKKSYKSYDKDTNEIVITTHDLDAKQFDPDNKYAPEVVRYSPEEYFSSVYSFRDSEWFNPADYFSQDLQGAPKGTLTTPEGKDYRVTNPNLKITAEGPRTQNIVGGNYTDGANLPGFGVDKGTGGSQDKKDTVDTIIDELTPYVKAGFTIGALDLLFNQGKITTAAFNWAKNNIFSGEIFNPKNWKDFKYQSVSGSGGASAGASAGASTVGNTGQSVIGSGGKYYIRAADGSAIEVAVDKVDLKTMTLTSPVQDISGALVQNVTVGKHVIPVGSKVTATPIGSGGTGGIVSGTKYTTTLKDGTEVVLSAEDAFVLSNGKVGVPPTDLRKYNTGEGALTTTADGVWNWKTGLAAVGAGLSLYDIIENGPSVANVSGLGYSVGVLAQGGVFGATAAAATAGATTTTAATTLGTAISVLGWVALAAGLIELFSGPPSTYVGEAAIDFDNDDYSADDILVGGFTGSKFSQENRDGAKSIISTAGGYVAAIEESLEINIGGELFVDVGNEFGLRYGYVDGYDEIGMYKYHEKDLDYTLLSGQGQVGKGLQGKDAAEQLMNKINDDINVVTMFALADKAAGGEGYATFDRMTEYRTKLSVLSTYKPAMAGSSTQAVLTEQERDLLLGFQQKEFAKVTGAELAEVLTLYDKIEPVHIRNQYQNFSGYGG